MSKVLIFDVETLGGAPHGIVASGAFLAVDFDADYTFDQLIEMAMLIKFDVKDQKTRGRLMTPDVMAWWKKQSKEAQDKLKPSSLDVDMITGLKEIAQYCKQHGITKNSFGFCRGQSFDFPLVVDMFTTANMLEHWPIAFWRQRDTRTWIASALGKIDIDKVPLPASVFNPSHFIAHDPIHDIARDVLMMQYAQKYACGEVEFPE